MLTINEFLAWSVLLDDGGSERWQSRFMCEYIKVHCDGGCLI